MPQPSLQLTLNGLNYHHPLSEHHFLTANQPLPQATFVPTCNMGDQSGSTHCRALFEAALQAYENNMGVKLSEHPLAMQLQTCRSIDSITMLFQQQTGTFRDFGGNDRIRKSIESTVSFLFTLSGTGALGGSIGLVHQIVLIRCLVSLIVLCLQAFPPTDAIQAALAILLGVCAILSSHLEVL
jgi:hypothetical protein